MSAICQIYFFYFSGVGVRRYNIESEDRPTYKGDVPRFHWYGCLLSGKERPPRNHAGRAISDTVKSSFRVILQDSRVKAIFVYIFGGLTRCDMIAEGIMMAFQDLNMSIPVVIRLRRTNEKIGQKRVYYTWVDEDFKVVWLTELLPRLRTVAYRSMHLTTLKMPRKKSSNSQAEQNSSAGGLEFNNLESPLKEDLCRHDA